MGLKLCPSNFPSILSTQIDTLMITIKNFYITIAIILGFGWNNEVHSQVIQGPSPVNLNNTYSYSYTSTYLLFNPSWTTVKGNVVSQSQNGLTYNVTITWTSSGSGIVRINEYDVELQRTEIVASKSVTISTCTTVAPTVVDGSRCGTGTVSLSGTPGSGGSTLRWYSALTGGTLLTTGTSYTTPSISTTTTYYVVTYNSSSSCESKPRTPVIATVNPIPGQPTPIHAARCGPGTITLTATPGSNANSIKWYSALTGGTLLGTGTSYITPSISSNTNYFITSYNSTTSCESSAPRQQITATVNSIPAAPTASGNHRFGSGTLTLTATGAPGGGTYKWYNPSGGLLYTGSTYITPTISSTTTNYLYVVSVSTTNCESAPVWVTINIYNTPIITSPNPNVVMGENVVLDAGTGYDSYVWKNSTNVQVGASQTFSTSITGDYTVTVTKGGVTSPPSASFRVKTQLEGQNMNYIVTEVLLSKVTDQALINNLPVELKNQTIQYFDELGRPIQTVITQGSPDKKDVVQPIVYDMYGRENRKYLPVVPNETKGWYKSGIIDSNGDFVGAALNFYNNGDGDKIADDAKPFAEAIYERSPLNRIIKQGSPGEEWQPDGTLNYTSTDHTIKSDFEFNSSADQVLKWTYTAPAGSLLLGMVNAGTAASPVYHNALTLYKTKLKDEHNNEIIEFKDKQGQTILKKVQVDATTYAQTYYIYDNYGNLVCVIPPEAVARLAAEFYQSGSDNTSKDTFLMNWAFRYNYDGLNRMIAKQVPGAKIVYLVYDNLDRLVMTQDGNLRLANKWTFTKYDFLNRPVISGIYTHGSNIDGATMAQLLSTTNFYETFSATYTSNHGYSNVVFPTTNTEILSVTYYDNYDFKSLIGNTEFNYKNNEFTSGQEPSEDLFVKGLVTGAKTNVLNTTNYLWAVTYYDKDYRTIQSISQNQKANGFDRVTNKYDFVKLIETKTKHFNGSVERNVNRKLVFDHATRLTQAWHKFNTEDHVLLFENEYNKIGELVTRKLHSRDSAGTFAQKIDFRYTIRGWLEKVNDIVSPEPTDLFSMKLNYNAPTSIVDAQFNGNVSEIIWGSAGSGKQSYRYKYDKLNRLTEANYFNSSRPTLNGRYTEKVGDATHQGYDLNGNIQKLLRYGKKSIDSYGLMDDLTYHYVGKGNQLTAVNDAIATNLNEDGFKEVIEATDEYLYDNNGSMTKDLNKDIALIEYNYLNLPKKVTKTNGEYVTYAYDASGRKLYQQVYNASSVLQKTTDYIGEFVYENNLLQFVNHEEGRIVADNSPGAPHPWEYQYNLKDHLGNVRLTFSEKTTTTEYKATLETATQTSEQNTFRNYSRNNFDLHDHTDAGTTFTYSQLLNAGNNSQIGLSKSFEVNPGDIVDLEVFAKYEEPTSTNANPSTLFTALVSAFTLNASGGTGLEGQQAYNSFNSYFGAGPAITEDEWEDDDAPKAYLNYLLFDENFVVVDFGFDQISVDAKQVGVSPIVPHDYLNLNVKVREKGYLYVYLSNENPTLANVYFDDFKITYRTAIEQSNDYYAFGLSIASTSFQKESSIKNNYLYNSKELQDELDLAWLDFGARMYLPEIGRWGVIDPLAEKMRRFTPYNYAYNNPIKFVDPDGMEATAATGETTEEMQARWASEWEEIQNSDLPDWAVRTSSKDPDPNTKTKTKTKTKTLRQVKTKTNSGRFVKRVLKPVARVVARVFTPILSLSQVTILPLLAMSGDTRKRDENDDVYTMMVAIENENLPEFSGHAAIGFRMNNGPETWFHLDINPAGEGVIEMVKPERMKEFVEDGSLYSKTVSKEEFERGFSAALKKTRGPFTCYSRTENSCVTNVSDILAIAHKVPKSSFRPLPSELAKFVQFVLHYSKVIDK